MHQQSTSKGLVFHQFYAFFFCDLSCMLSNWFCTCTLENLCRKVHDSLLGSMHGCANVGLKKLSTVWTGNLFSNLHLMDNFLVSFQGSYCHVFITDITSSYLYYLDCSCCLIHLSKATDQIFLCHVCKLKYRDNIT